MASSSKADVSIIVEARKKHYYVVTQDIELLESKFTPILGMWTGNWMTNKYSEDLNIFDVKDSDAKKLLSTME